MADFIVKSSITWDGKETLEYFLRPLFIGKQPHETQGVRVYSGIRSKQKLNYFSAVKKLLKAYVKGFNASSGSTYTQREIEVFRMKAESADDALDFFQTVYENVLPDDWNRIDDTILKKIIMDIYSNAIESDVYREYWHNVTGKEQQTSGLNNGTADTNYNAFDGMWQLIFENAAIYTPGSAFGDLSIRRIEIDTSAVAQVATVTLTGGSSANLVLTFQGTNYTTAYLTSYTVTAAAFVTAHAAALLLRDVVVTSSGADIIFTSSKKGQPFLNPTFASATTITGSVASTTANTSAGDLSSGQSEDIFKDVVTNSHRTLKSVPKKQKYLLTTDSMLENWEEYNESLGTEKSHTMLIDGIEFPTYRGIPIISLSWEDDLADFPHTDGENPAYPHRVILTAKDNLVLGLNSLSSYAKTRFWYNEDEEENRFRSKFEMGAQYVHNEFMTVAY